MFYCQRFARRYAEPGVRNLRWFGSYKRDRWEVGKKREAYASGRGWRYQSNALTEVHRALLPSV